MNLELMHGLPVLNSQVPISRPVLVLVSLFLSWTWSKPYELGTFLYKKKKVETALSWFTQEKGEGIYTWMGGRDFWKEMAFELELGATGRILTGGRHPRLREQHTQRQGGGRATLFCRSQSNFLGVWVMEGRIILDGKLGVGL